LEGFIMPTFMSSSTRAPVLAACRWLVIAGVFSAVANLLLLAVPLYSFQVLDRVLSSGHLDTLIWLTVIAGFAVVVLGWLDALRAALLVQIGIRFEHQLGRRVLQAQMIAQGPEAGEALRDLAAFRSFVTSGLSPFLDAPWVPAFAVVLWLMHPVLGAAALLSAAVLFGLALLNERLLRRSAVLGNTHQMAAQRQADAVRGHADAIRAMGMMPALADRWGAAQDQALAAHAAGGAVSAALGGLVKFARLAIQIAVMGIGAWLALRGELTPGGMIAASMLLSRALAPVEQSIGAWRQASAAQLALHRINAVLGQMPVTAPGLELPAPLGALRIEGLAYHPATIARAVLSGITLQMAAGAALGIVGPSGSGKSTLARLIAGATEPTAGVIRFDGADRRGWSTDRLGPHIGYLPQSVTLFDASVAQNIARMGAFQPGDVVAAARAAGVHEMILTLPQGYDTVVGAEGVPLSGGQRQRIGLARALFGNPAFVILDEPNSHLDGAGEAALAATLRHLKQVGTTVIVVAHHPALMARMDRIVVLRGGTVTLSGTPAEVLPRLSLPAAPAARLVQKA
jgi:PrtD family type I secretion system ABC transporter